MSDRLHRTALRLFPALLAFALLASWFDYVQAQGPYVLRNLLPPFVVLLMFGLFAWRNNGRLHAADWRLPLAILGFAIPAVGLSIYLHLAFLHNLNGLFDGARQPAEVFRFLPAYTSLAGLIGAGIGWTIGRAATEK